MNAFPSWSWAIPPAIIAALALYALTAHIRRRLAGARERDRVNALEYAEDMSWLASDEGRAWVAAVNAIESTEGAS